MRASHRSTLLALLAAGLLVPAYLAWTGGAPAAAAGVPVQALVLDAGQRGSYEIRVDSRVRMPTGVEVTQGLAATLELCVLEGAGGSAEVGLRLASLQLALDGRRDPLREAALMAPVVARFVGGTIDGLTFPDGLTDETRRQLDSLFRIFQCAIPPGSEPVLVVEEDGLGRYRARYQRSGERTVERQKAAYLSGMAPGGVPCAVRVLRAEGSFTFEPGGPWLQAADVREEFELSSMGNLAAHIWQEASLRLRARGRVAPPADWLGGAARAVTSSRQLERASVSAVQPRAATADEGRAFRAALEAFVAGAGADRAAMYALARQLTQSPELAAEVEAVLRRPELAASAASALCHALELAGTTQGQTSLASLGLDGRLSSGLRFAAVAALGGVAEPTEAAEEALFRLAHGGDPSLASTAWLALGSVGSRVRAQDAGRYAGLRMMLADQATQAVGEDAAVVALRALGNTKDPELADAALTRIDDRAAPVRAAAAETAGAIGGEAVAPALENALRRERDPQVRVSMVNGLLRTGDLARATATCASLIADEAHESARYAMARVLADQLGAQPELRPVLERLLEHETSAPTIAYVAGRLHRMKAR